MSPSMGSGLLDEFLVRLPQEIAETLAGDLTALLGDLAPNLVTDALSGL